MPPGSKCKQAAERLMDSAQRFFDLWEWCGGHDGAAERTLLETAYGDPARTYHNWTHINAMLNLLDGVRSRGEFADVELPEVELAIFFHDVVYDPQAKDNEQRSAAVLRSMSAGIDVGLVWNVCLMIVATEKHGPSEDASTRLLLDLDLAILGAPSDDYDGYATAVRKEYAFLPDERWNTGRKRVLERFLERPVVYQTGHFQDLLEQNARQNIQREIAGLSA